MAKRREKPSGMLVVKAPAKVNLYLRVLGRRPDGYHEIRTVMQAVSLYDELTFNDRADGKIVLKASAAGLPAPEENLAFRAAVLLKERLAPGRGVEIRLAKGIPVGGGLGGGSSDAAATLRALDRLWALRLGVRKLEALAAELGSDVPFFVRGGTALCEGRGERVTPLPTRAAFSYVLVTPRFSTSTRAVYHALADDLTTRCPKDSIDSVRGALMAGDPGRLGCGLRNDLGAAAFRVNPGLRRLGEWLAGALHLRGCFGFSLSGSGSSFFGVFGCADAARREAKKLGHEPYISAVAVRSLPAEVIEEP